MKLDLHCHSTCSDGVLAPQELIQRARAKGVDYLAITDHDSLDTIDHAHSIPGTVYIPGVELSVVSTLTNKKFHLLGLFPNATVEKIAPFKEFLAIKRYERISRAHEIIDKLNTHFQLNIDFLDFCKFMNINLATNTSEQTIGRPHIADYMISRGIVRNRKDAFWKYLPDSSPAYVPNTEYALDYAISDIKQAGGFSFIAHCMLFENDRLEEDIKAAFAHGLDGLEVYHAANSRDFERIKYLTPVFTLGSDWHDEHTIWDLGCPIGNYLMSEGEKQRLLEFLGLNEAFK